MKQIIKTIAFLSAIAGGILGLVLLIPVLNVISCLLLFTVIGAGLIIYLKKNALIGIVTIHQGAILGAIAGFISMTAASVIYLPLSYLINFVIGMIHKTSLASSFSLLTASYSLFVIAMLVFFMAMLSALFNAFTGMVAAFVFEKLENASELQETEFTIEN